MAWKVNLYRGYLAICNPDDHHLNVVITVFILTAASLSRTFIHFELFNVWTFRCLSASRCVWKIVQNKNVCDISVNCEF